MSYSMRILNPDMFGAEAMRAAAGCRSMVQGSIAVVKTVASLEGVDPAELSPQLYHVVDPDALDDLLETDSVQVTFTFAGYRVTLQRNGDIHAESVENIHHSA
jgi:hypothetical protein